MDHNFQVEPHYIYWLRCFELEMRFLFQFYFLKAIKDAMRDILNKCCGAWETIHF